MFQDVVCRFFPLRVGRGVQNIYGQILVLFFCILYYIVYYVCLTLINNFAILNDS